jgi:hypothetical protein
MDDNGCKMMTIPHMNMCLGLIAKTYMARNRLNASVRFSVILHLLVEEPVYPTSIFQTKEQQKCDK